jgi:hypothetical protein
MQRVQVFYRQESLGDAALVAHYDHAEIGTVKEGDGLDDSRENLHLLPTGNIFIFRRGLSVDNAVTI